MNEPVCYYSTNRRARDVDLASALLEGQAHDRGLYLPDHLPAISVDELVAWKDLPYARIATEILKRFTDGMIAEPRLAELCRDAYDYAVPLEHVTDRRYLLRLDQGPTASFKDFAARMMARWMGELMAEQPGELVILTATSGDTGSAVAHAYQGVDRMHVVVLFPVAEVSDRQRKQMTTIGGNVAVFGVEGKFDDCQAMVKRAFSDPQLANIRLTSANSINIGRLLPQAVYYIYAYVRLADAAAGEPIIFSVPSGNFGDMMGAVLAWRMGLPIERLIIATNENDEVPRFLSTGRYEKLTPSRVCISNAMNVGHPSNLARLVDVYGGWMDETGALRRPPDLERLRRDLYAISITDDQTRATIKATHAQHGVILEPHGAVGWAGLERFLGEHPDLSHRLAVSVETAHPAKFPEEIETAIGVDPTPPPSLAGLESKSEHYDVLSTQYEPFRELLLSRYANR